MKVKNIITVCVLLYGTILLSQSVVFTQTGTPLTITDIASTPGSGDREVITMMVQNVSTKAIEAYGIIATRTNDSGKQLSTKTHLTLLSAARKDNVLEPNGTMQNKLKGPAGTGGHIELSLDYVLFENGEKWGPDKMKFAEAVTQLRTRAAVQK